MYYVYLIQSLKDGKYYIGQTNDFQKRLKEHNEGKVKSTKHRTPFKLIGYEEYEKRNEARWREHSLKKSVWKRKKFISDLTTRSPNL
ncbi:GIY-YIG nuclease family protein [Patescibacteria group bacterium]|nr:GIY-YIG nuclease family protein [Patescibacteria group bacterium]MCG2702591.1 GIY-YIG nuclease family protein [Candidatus Parcubacteria bacterium]MBU4265516.1 GIY-YIG nuclease family protein [Patescibacteria group bacterium]MBU4390566.1 GIY-YIG nuclease family protein [Patescibacteria group bacterium]MBU4396644.1 GIY-YIG nuclease family protein [Patescibacteria group bacterium]